MVSFVIVCAGLIALLTLAGVYADSGSCPSCSGRGAHRRDLPLP